MTRPHRIATFFVNTLIPGMLLVALVATSVFDRPAQSSDENANRVQPDDIPVQIQKKSFDSLALRDDLALREDDAVNLLPRTREKLVNHQPLKIVCFGDSVTGVYYHTGSHRAYPEMIPFALRAADSDIDVTVINAGISGHTTINGLARIERDVLDHKPDLVTVMFTLNDMTRVPIPDFEANLRTIIERCRAIEAEVLLCTTNGVIDTPGRPIARLLEFNDAIKKVGETLSVPVCDIYSAYEKIKTERPRDFRLLMSDEIHPNMDGHKINAEEICLTLTGKKVSIAEIEPEEPGLTTTATRIMSGETVRVLAMTPYDQLIAKAFKDIAADVTVEVIPWVTEGKSLAQLEQESAQVRNANPKYDFVLLGVPLSVTPADEAPTEAEIKSYIWTLNWSCSFGKKEWDVAAVTPAVLNAEMTDDEQARNRFARRLMHAQHIHMLDRKKNDSSSPEKILADWLKTQLPGK